MKSLRPLLLILAWLLALPPAGALASIPRRGILPPVLPVLRTASVAEDDGDALTLHLDGLHDRAGLCRRVLVRQNPWSSFDPEGLQTGVEGAAVAGWVISTSPATSAGATAAISTSAAATGAGTAGGLSICAVAAPVLIVGAFVAAIVYEDEIVKAFPGLAGSKRELRPSRYTPPGQSDCVSGYTAPKAPREDRGHAFTIETLADRDVYQEFLTLLNIDPSRAHRVLQEYQRETNQTQLRAFVAVKTGAVTDQYALKAVEDGFYPVMKYGFAEPQAGIFLKAGVVGLLPESCSRR